MSPPEHKNVWKVWTYTAPQTTDLSIPEDLLEMVDCNLDVAGFKIYGEFRNIPQVASKISSPTVRGNSVWDIIISSMTLINSPPAQSQQNFPLHPTQFPQQNCVPRSKTSLASGLRSNRICLGQIPPRSEFTYPKTSSP